MSNVIIVITVIAFCNELPSTLPLEAEKPEEPLPFFQVAKVSKAIGNKLKEALFLRNIITNP
jgi:hypothetical protein